MEQDVARAIAQAMKEGQEKMAMALAKAMSDSVDRAVERLADAISSLKQENGAFQLSGVARLPQVDSLPVPNALPLRGGGVVQVGPQGIAHEIDPMPPMHKPIDIGFPEAVIPIRKPDLPNINDLLKPANLPDVGMPDMPGELPEVDPEPAGVIKRDEFQKDRNQRRQQFIENKANKAREFHARKARKRREWEDRNWRVPGRLSDEFDIGDPMLPERDNADAVFDDLPMPEEGERQPGEPPPQKETDFKELPRSVDNLSDYRRFLPPPDIRVGRAVRGDLAHGIFADDLSGESAAMNEHLMLSREGDSGLGEDMHLAAAQHRWRDEQRRVAQRELRLLSDMTHDLANDYRRLEEIDSAYERARY